MGISGQVGTGAGFLVVGLWKFFFAVKAHVSPEKPSSRRTPSWPRYSEHALVGFIALLHIISDLIATGSHGNNGVGVGKGFAWERLGVAAVFLLYALVAVISESTSLLPLPAGMVDFVASAAFAEEFTLFYVTSGEEHTPGLEVQYYSLLRVPIGVCMLATTLEMVYPVALLPRLVRGAALVLQGTWFFQMAASLHSKYWMARGCEVVQKSEGIHTVSCEGMSLMRGRALATLEFNCHLALLLVILLPIYGVLNRGHNVPANYERLDDHQGFEGRELGGANKEQGQELAQSSYFHVLGDDEEDELGGEIREEEIQEVEQMKDLPGSNGFHRVRV